MSRTDPLPPWMAATLIRLTLPKGVVRETVWGDLLEEFRVHADARGVRSARRWYYRQAVDLLAGYCVPAALHRRSYPRVADAGKHGDGKVRRGDALATSFVQDIRYAARSFWRAPAFVGIAVLTMAIGIGANTAIFSVVNGVVLKPLPYPDPDRIVRPWAEKIFSQGMFVEFREQTGSFDHMALFTGGAFALSGGDVPELIDGGAVTADYFDVFGINPLIGRTLRSEDERPGAEAVVVLNYGLWQSSFGGDPAIIGRTIAIDGAGTQTRTVVGVMPTTFEQFNNGWQVWVPQTIDAADPVFLRYGNRLLARLAPGITIEQARADVGRLVPSFREEHPTQFRPVRLSPIPVLSLHETIVGDVKTTLWLLLGAVGLVLLMACTNVANLLLAQAGAREREIALRMALGAGRRRVVRQLLTESGMLAAIGGAAGVAVAIATLAICKNFLLNQVPRAGNVGVDMTVLAFSISLSVLAGLIFGTAPAVRGTRHGPGAALTCATGNVGVGRSRNRLNNMLVVAEMALATVLVIGAGLVLKSFAQLKRVDVGFGHEQLVTLRPRPSASRFGEAEQQRQYFEAVLERVKAVPGVDGASTINNLPMTQGNVGIPYLVEGQDLPVGIVSQVVNLRVITPDYFETMNIPLVQGRRFTTADREDTEQVGIVNQTFVATHWPGENPVGRRILQTNGDAFATVIGVVQDIQQHRLDQAPRPLVYLHVAQLGYGNPFLVVRTTTADPARMLSTVREAVQSVDRNVPIVNVSTMEDVVGASLGNKRFYTSLFSAFAVLALLLGSIGVYGVMSYVTSQRTREFGIRVALGAAPGQVLRSTLRTGLVPVATGIGIGIAIALGLTRILSSLLFEVAATDPIIFGGVALVLAVMGIAANYVPAARAANVDPMVVLKE